MKREIVCKDCFRPHLADPFDSYRFYKPLRGELIRSGCVCDSCNRQLEKGERITCLSYAFTESDYQPWENDYVSVR